MAQVEWRITGPSENMPTRDSVGNVVVLEQSVPVNWYLVEPAKDPHGNTVDKYTVIHSGGVLVSADASAKEIEDAIEERTQQVIDEYKSRQLQNKKPEHYLSKRRTI